MSDVPIADEKTKGRWSNLVIVVLLGVPLGLSLGTWLALVSTFGATHMMDQIMLNQDTFVKQFARGIVLQGWVSATIALLIAWILGIRAAHRGRRGRPRRGAASPLSRSEG